MFHGLGHIRSQICTHRDSKLHKSCTVSEYLFSIVVFFNFIHRFPLEDCTNHTTPAELHFSSVCLWSDSTHIKVHLLYYIFCFFLNHFVRFINEVITFKDFYLFIGLHIRDCIFSLLLLFRRAPLFAEVPCRIFISIHSEAYSFKKWALI